MNIEKAVWAYAWADAQGWREYWHASACVLTRATINVTLYINFHEQGSVLPTFFSL